MTGDGEDDREHRMKSELSSGVQLTVNDPIDRAQEVMNAGRL